MSDDSTAPAAPPRDVPPIDNRWLSKSSVFLRAIESAENEIARLNVDVRRQQDRLTMDLAGLDGVKQAIAEGRPYPEEEAAAGKSVPGLPRGAGPAVVAKR